MGCRWEGTPPATWQRGGQVGIQGAEDSWTERKQQVSVPAGPSRASQPHSIHHCGNSTILLSLPCPPFLSLHTQNTHTYTCVRAHTLHTHTHTCTHTCSHTLHTHAHTCTHTHTHAHTHTHTCTHTHLHTHTHTHAHTRAHTLHTHTHMHTHTHTHTHTHKHTHTITHTHTTFTCSHLH